MALRNSVIFLLLLALGAGLQGLGQVVNIESKRLHTDSLRFAGSAQMALLLNSTNGKDIFTIRGNAVVQWKSKNYRHLWLNVINYDFAKADDDDYVNNFYDHFRYNYKVNEWLRWEAFAQIQVNEPLGIAYRQLLGTGPRFKIPVVRNTDLYLGTAYMYEIEKTIPPTVTKSYHSRWSNYLSFNIHFPPINGLITSTTYYQPRFDQFSDFRISTETRFSFMITHKWSIYTTFNYLFDSRPPQDIRKSALNLEQGFGISF